MKRIIYGISFLALVGTFVVGCQKENLKPNLSEATTKEVINPKETTPKSKSRLVIVSWDDWGRKKKECNGNGLCNARWLYSIEPDLGNHFTPLQFDETTHNYFIEIFIDENDFPIDEEHEIFGVDEDILLNTEMEESIGLNLIIPIGEYLYDETIGNYGGYRIILTL